MKNEINEINEITQKALVDAITLETGELIVKNTIKYGKKVLLDNIAKLLDIKDINTVIAEILIILSSFYNENHIEKITTLNQATLISAFKNKKHK